LRSFFNLWGLGLRSLGKLFFIHLRLGRFWLSLWFSRSYRFSWRWRLIILKLLNVTLFFYGYSNDLRERMGQIIIYTDNWCLKIIYSLVSKYVPRQL
jgi:hypothetical protein